MKRALRYLRIGWSVFFGVLCIMLIALWVRSYWASDYILIQGFFGVTSLETNCGTVIFKYMNSSPPVPFDWLHRASPTFALPGGFYWAPIKSTTIIHFPIALPVLILAAFTLTPWLHWSRRFSLRTLLIAITLIALALGLVVSLR